MEKFISRKIVPYARGPALGWKTDIVGLVLLGGIGYIAWMNRGKIAEWISAQIGVLGGEITGFFGGIGEALFAEAPGEPGVLRVGEPVVGEDVALFGLGPGGVEILEPYHEPYPPIQITPRGVEFFEPPYEPTPEEITPPPLTQPVAFLQEPPVPTARQWLEAFQAYPAAAPEEAPPPVSEPSPLAPHAWPITRPILDVASQVALAGGDPQQYAKLYGMVLPR